MAGLELQLDTEADLELVGSPGPVALTWRAGGQVILNNFTQTFQVRKLLSSPLAAVKVELSVPVGLATEQGNSVLLDIADSQLGGSVEGGTRSCRVNHTPRPAQPSPSTPNLDCSVAGVLCSKVVCGPFPLKTNRTA